MQYSLIGPSLFSILYLSILNQTKSSQLFYKCLGNNFLFDILERHLAENDKIVYVKNFEISFLPQSNNSNTEKMYQNSLKSQHFNNEIV